MADEEGFRVATAFVQVDPDTSDFREKLQAALDEAVAGVKADVSVGANTDQAKADLDEVKAKVDELKGDKAEIQVSADAQQAKDDLDEVKAKRDEIDGSDAGIKVTADAQQAKDDLDEVKAKLGEIDGDRAEATLGLDDDDFRTKLAEDEAALKSLHGSATLGGSGGGGGGEGEGGSLFGAITLGAASALPGIAAAGAGLGLLGGTAGLAFGGVAKALSAHSQASQNVGLTQAQLASTAFSNAVAIQQAQQAERQAYQQAAEAASQSAAQVESAQMSQAETVRNAAASQAQALQAVTQAQQGEQQASFGLSQAQYNLQDAWIQARYALEQLNDAEHDNATTIKAARLAVAQAEYQQRLTDENAMSTSLDRQQAAISVTQAQEQLTAAQQQASYNTAQANLQDKAGVAGSQQVVQAKQAVKQAMQAVHNAAVAERDAVRNLTDTELNNADQVKAAQLAVSQAVQQAAYQQEQAAQAEQNAAQNVANTQKEQRLQALATASTSNQAANQFIRDMARLSPAARSFVRELLGMHGAVRTLEGDAQSAILPGMTVFLQGVKSVMPEIRAGVTGMGRAISSAFSQFGHLMQTPAFAQGLQGLISNGIQFASTVLPAFATFLQQLGLLGSRKGAVTGLADGLRGLGLGLAGLVKGLTPYIPVFNQIFQVIGKFLQDLGPELAQTIGATAEAFRPLFAFLNSSAGQPFLKLLAGVAAGMLTLKGLAKILPGDLGKFAGKIPELIAAPLKKVGGSLLKAGAGWAKSLGGSLLGGLQSLAGRVPGILGRGWELAGQGAVRVFGSGGLVSRGFAAVQGYAGTAAGVVARWGGRFAGAVGTAAGTMARWGSQFGGQLASMAGSAASFAAQTASRLASAAGATAAWIAENSVAAATYIGENVAMAASATAAFIAENAATLGIAAGIAALVAAIVFAATHWHEVWGAIKAVAEDAWHFITTGWGKWLFPEITLLRDAIGFLGSHWSEIWGAIKSVTESVYDDAIKPVFSAIGTGASLLVNDVILPAFHLWMDQFTLLENAALWLWHNVLDPVWQGIETGARNFVSGFETVWNTLIKIFRTPVNFLITTVYDNGIRRLWDDVVNAVGLKSLDLPHIPALAGGGIVPGRDTGRDTQLVAMRPQEGVLVPEAVAGIGGPSVVHALNEAHSGRKSGAGRGPGGMPAFKHGGILGFIDRGLGDIGHWLADAGKFAAEVAVNPAGAVTSVLDKFIHTDAAGNLGKVMTAIPRALIGDLAKVFGADMSSLMGGGSTGGLGGSATGQQIVRFAESFIGKVPYVYGGTGTSGWDCSSFVDYVYEHYGFHPPRTSEEQYRWVQRTPSPVLGGLAFFTGSPQDPPPGHVGIVTGTNQMVDAYGTGFGTRLNSIQGSSGAVMGFGVPPGGGLLAVGSSGGGVTPDLLTIARYLTGHGASRAAAAGIAGTIAGEAPGGNPLSVGTGGGGILGWTPISSAYPLPILTDSNPAHQMAVQLVDMMAYIERNGSIQDMNRAALGGPMNAAWHWSAAYERPAVTGSDIRPDVVSALYRAGYDSGGWLMPAGMPGSVPVNSTGQPEAVLTPAESQAWVALVKRMLAQPGGGLGAPTAVFNYLGTQAPTPEQQAMMKRDWALALSSG